VAAGNICREVFAYAVRLNEETSFKTSLCEKVFGSGHAWAF